MSDDNKGSQDLTRIEDLSDFIHNEDEEISLLDDNESNSMMDMEKESFGDSTSFIQVPEELSSDISDDEIEDISSPTSFNDFDEETQTFSNNFDEELNSKDQEFSIDNDNNDNQFINDDFVAPDETFDSSDEDEFISDNFLENELSDDTFNDSNFSNDSFDENVQSDNNFESSDFTDTNLSEDVLVDSTDKNEEEILTDTDHSLDNLSNSEDIPEVVEEKKEEPKTTTPPPITAPKNFKEPESLNDVKDFAEVITATDLSIEGNPPFSVILSKIKYHEDSLEILDILKELQIIKEDNDEDARASLERGQILIPRLSEYAAIVLCHKMRRFDLNLKMGLSQEIHANSTFEKSDKGLISRKSILSNKKITESFKESDIKLEDIQITTLSSFENHSVLKNLGIISKSKSIPNEELTSDLFETTYKTTSEELMLELKNEAKKLNVNGLLGVTINLINNPIEGQTNFICTANTVLVSEK